jgi:hypothetical protein
MTKKKKIVRRLLVCLGLILLAIAGIRYSIWKVKELEKERLATQRSDAIARIDSLFRDKAWVSEQVKKADSSGDWITGDFMLLGSGEWLVYYSRCSKEDSQATSSYDMFIARGSNGKWYFSTWHFCIRLMNLTSDGRPESLADFELACYLKEFDGISKNCPQSTWPFKDELRIEANGGDSILVARVADNAWSEVRVCAYGKLFTLNEQELNMLQGVPPGHHVTVSPDSVDYHFEYSLTENGIPVNKEVVISVNTEKELSVTRRNAKN